MAALGGVGLLGLGGIAGGGLAAFGGRSGGTPVTYLPTGVAASNGAATGGFTPGSPSSWGGPGGLPPTHGQTGIPGDLGPGGTTQNVPEPSDALILLTALALMAMLRSTSRRCA